MVKHTSFIHLLITFLLGLAAAIDLPNCNAADFFKILPLVPQEAYIINLNTLFAGYNLNFNATVDPDIAKYVQLGSKVTQQNQEFPDTPFDGLKNCHLEHERNGWGQQFIAMSQKESTTMIHYGILPNDQKVPVINKDIMV